VRGAGLISLVGKRWRGVGSEACGPVEGGKKSSILKWEKPGGWGGNSGGETYFGGEVGIFGDFEMGWEGRLASLGKVVHGGGGGRRDNLASEGISRQKVPRFGGNMSSPGP